MSRQFHLDKYEGKIMGVCAGLADYTGVNALWIRVAAVMLTLFVSFFTIPLYIVTGLLAENKPFYKLGADDAWKHDVSRSDGLAGRVRDIERGSTNLSTRYSTNSRLANEIDTLR